MPITENLKNVSYKQPREVQNQVFGHSQMDRQDSLIVIILIITETHVFKHESIKYSNLLAHHSLYS